MAPSLIESSAPAAAAVPTKAGLRSDSAQDALDAAISRFTATNPSSAKLYQQATETLPGGNTRTQLFTEPFPVFMKSGKGYQVTSEDGQTYTDFVGELTAGLYGHNHPVIIAAIKDVLENVGLNLGATTVQEQIHARAICDRYGLDIIRFTNSGTEANMNALAGARAFTAKRKIVVFGGGYHGGVFSFPKGVPAPNCVDLNDWIVAKFNDIESAKTAIRSEGVAAVLLEGMQGSSGMIRGTPEFLHAVQETAKEAGVLFMLDEVMTSRVAPGGFASLHDLKPDIKIFGKYLGGGLSFGAFGGRADVMAVYDPRSGTGLTHHGTFNNNTLSLHVGHAGLTKIYTPEVCEKFNTAADKFRERLNQVSKGSKLFFTGLGALNASHITQSGQRSVQNDEDIQEDQTLKDLFWYEMMEAGFWLARRGSLVLVLGTPQSELDRFVDSVAAFLDRHKPLFTLDTSK